MLLQANIQARLANDQSMIPSVVRNVTGNSSELGYTEYPHMDLHGSYDLQTALAMGSSCFNVSDLTHNMTAVNNCHSSKSSLCCVRTTDLPFTVVSKDLIEYAYIICSDVPVMPTDLAKGLKFPFAHSTCAKATRQTKLHLYPPLTWIIEQHCFLFTPQQSCCAGFNITRYSCPDLQRYLCQRNFS